MEKLQHIESELQDTSQRELAKKYLQWMKEKPKTPFLDESASDEEKNEVYAMFKALSDGVYSDLHSLQKQYEAKLLEESVLQNYNQ